LNRFFAHGPAVAVLEFRTQRRIKASPRLQHYRPRRSMIAARWLPNTGNLIVEPKPKLNRHLPVIDDIVGDVAACFDDLKPVNVVQSFTSLGNGILHGIFHTRFGRPGQLDLFVNMIAHWKASFLRLQYSQVVQLQYLLLVSL
jgi:hypothetical protein